MSVRGKDTMLKGNLGVTNESRSLWNYTLSPGWSVEEAEILSRAIIKYGVGNWNDILKSKCLPNKTRSQLNLQTQRLIGQQSLGEFMGVHLDPREVYMYLMEERKDVKRKNGCIINEGNNPTVDERRQKILQNKQKWAKTPLEIEQIVVVALVDKEAIEKELETLKEYLKKLETRLQTVESKPEKHEKHEKQEKEVKNEKEEKPEKHEKHEKQEKEVTNEKEEKSEKK